MKHIATVSQQSIPATAENLETKSYQLGMATNAVRLVVNILDWIKNQNNNF